MFPYAQNDHFLAYFLRGPPLFSSKFFVLLVVAYCIGWLTSSGQLFSKFCRDNPLFMAVCSLPVSYLFIMATRLGYDEAGSLWSIRAASFGVSTGVFTILTCAFLRELPAPRDVACLLLAAAIVVVQVTKPS